MKSRPSESGVALITVLLLLVLTSGMLAGFTSLVISDVKLRGSDRTQTQAFYAAHGALEKLTADITNLFMTNVAPTSVEIHALETSPPVIPDVQFVAKDGGSG
ncbi:MAG: PilX N-terminal domain-containing pilus assembly protein, partial [Vicinamibacterales bacterium]